MSQQKSGFFAPQEDIASNLNKKAIYFIYTDKDEQLAQKVHGFMSQQLFENYDVHAILHEKIKNNQQLKEAVASIGKRICGAGYNKIVLLGLSQGGLICAALAEESELKPRVSSVTTIKTCFIQIDDQQIVDITKAMLVEADDWESSNALLNLNEKIGKSKIDYHFIVDGQDENAMKEPTCYNEVYVASHPRSLLVTKTDDECLAKLKNILKVFNERLIAGHLTVILDEYWEEDTKEDGKLKATAG